MRWCHHARITPPRGVSFTRVLLGAVGGADTGVAGIADPGGMGIIVLLLNVLLQEQRHAPMGSALRIAAYRTVFNNDSIPRN
jgi:hypothetical protein